MILREAESGRPRQFQGVIVGAEDVSMAEPAGGRRNVRMFRIQISKAAMANKNVASTTFLIDEGRSETIRVVFASGAL